MTRVSGISGVTVWAKPGFLGPLGFLRSLCGLGSSLWDLCGLSLGKIGVSITSEVTVWAGQVSLGSLRSSMGRARVSGASVVPLWARLESLGHLGSPFVLGWGLWGLWGLSGLSPGRTRVS